MSNYLDELNEGQRAAVVYTDGHSLVVAGAGSGKTRVLTCKIAFLLENGFQPGQILALTFTNKAAREMKARIARQVGDTQASRLWMGTFHSIFLRMLHMDAALLGFSPQFTVYDTADSKSLIRSILKELDLSEKIYRPGTVQARISQAKNRLITPEQYAANRQTVEDDRKHGMPALREVYQRYWNRLRQADAMDFDDLLSYTHILLRDHPDVAARYHDRLRYILVDEYQDTNYAQHRIVEQLCGEGCRVCVVGDDAQSIYSFRGAEIDNMLRFTDSFPGARTFKLEQNYRSTQNIVGAANSLIAHNQHQIRKTVFSRKDEGNPIEVLAAFSDVDEGEQVATKVSDLHRRERRAYDQFAILYRTHAQSRIFEEALRRHDIAYRIYGGLSFYQRKEVKDVIAYFRLAVNPHDEEALKRVINYPTRGIGDTTLDRLTTAAAEGGVSLWAALGDPASVGLRWNAGTAAKLQGFRNLIEGFVAQAAQADASRLGTDIIRQAGIVADLYKDNSPEGVARQENLEELVNGLGEFCTARAEEGRPCLLGDFLSEVSLLTDQDADKTGQESRVTLMTVHSAKGLEFPVVFVVGLEEGLFPNGMASNSPRDMEEERRLFYVALTRAEERCYLSHAKARRRYGLMDFATPSRFLRDIDPRYLSLSGEAERPWADGGRMRTRATSVAGRTGRSLWGKEASDEDRTTSGRKTTEEERPQTAFLPAGIRRLISTGRVPSGLKNSEITSPTPPPVDAPGAPANGSVSPPVEAVNAGRESRAKPGRNPYGIEVGQTVEHQRFGLGEVVGLEGDDASAKATIRFRNAGTKQLLLRFARLQVVDASEQA